MKICIKILQILLEIKFIKIKQMKSTICIILMRLEYVESLDDINYIKGIHICGVPRTLGDSIV